MRFLLISPPVSNIGQAAPSISVLTAWLRSKGHECAQWDLGLEVFHFFHSRQYMAMTAQLLKNASSADQDEEMEPARRARRPADAASGLYGPVVRQRS